jgi:hypothetical protein
MLKSQIIDIDYYSAMIRSIIRKIKPTGIRKLSDHNTFHESHVKLDTYLTSLENRLTGSQKEIKADLLAFQKEAQARLEASQKEAQVRQQEAQARQEAFQREFKSDMGKFLNIFAYKIVALALGSAAAMVGGMDYCGVYPWKKRDSVQEFKEQEISLKPSKAPGSS